MGLIVHDCEQGSAEWLALRLGRVTSSGAVNVLPLRDLDLDAKGKGRDNEKSRMDYALRLALERVTGAPVTDESFSSVAMERGHMVEPVAREYYVKLAHPTYDVREVGFLSHETEMYGDSPDGLVYDGDCIVGGVELKCPGPVVHWEYLQAGVVPKEYWRQMLHHLWSNESAAWWDFASYHPTLPGKFAWFEVRWEREKVKPLLDIYDAAVRQFMEQVNTLEAQIRAEA